VKQKNIFSHFPQLRINLQFAAFLSLALFAISSAKLSAENLPSPELSNNSEGSAPLVIEGERTVSTTRSVSAAHPASATHPTSATHPVSAKHPASVKFPATSSTYDDVVVEKYQFGVVTDHSGATKDWKLHPVVVIPNLPGIQYAWKLKLNRSSPVFVREEFTLPEAPSSWKIKDGETSSQLLKGGEECVLESFQTTDGGWIGHSWSASLGDPPGRYQIKIWLNGKLARIFTFNVGEPTEIDRQKRDI
jgi:hypothetical protein